jgi:molybdenum cofactor synthesis domain-containing protein
MRDPSAVLPTPPFVTERLLAPEQAIVVYFGRAVLAPPGLEHVSLDDAGGRVLAEDARAREEHPTHRRSTMDGFAVCSWGEGMRRRIVGRILMGAAPPRAIAPDEALHIPTGGALPEGADAVVPIEGVDEEAETIVLHAPVRAGDCFVPPGEDVAAGEIVLRAGRRLGGPELGVLATLGIARVPVYRRPVFGVISTGDELVDAAQPLAIGHVRDSNRYAIGASLEALGAIALQLPRVVDDPNALRKALAAALERCDGIVLTGGSSVGERDHTPQIVAELGAPGPIVHGLRVKPGKPTLLAAVGSKPIIGLPGNPASCLMILEAIVRPIVAACTGLHAWRPVALEAVAAAPFVGREGWTWYVPARLRGEAGKLFAEPAPIRSSHTSLLARAGGYASIGEWPARIEAGATVLISLFASGGAPVEAA